jgi:hypothetical protein
MAEEVGALGWREARDNIAKRVPKRRDGSHSLVTTVELAIMLRWQEKPHPSAVEPKNVSKRNPSMPSDQIA